MEKTIFIGYSHIAYAYFSSCTPICAVQRLGKFGKKY